MVTVSQKAFSGGEISPFLYQRVDVEKYKTGLRTLRNCYTLRHGGLSSRPGSKFLAEVKDSTKETRLIEFFFNNEQTFILEVGENYIRFFKDDVQISETAQNITGITQANPAVISITGHGYSNGDEVQISGIVGMTELNGRNFKVANANPNDFEITDLQDNNIDSTSFDAYVSGGSSAKVYEVATSYLEDELFDIRFTQSADVVTVVHPNHRPVELSRVADNNWSIDELNFNPEQIYPTAIAGSGPGGGENYKYKVTAINDESAEQSLPGIANITAGVITNVTQADPAVVTLSVALVPQWEDGDEIRISGVVGMEELNDRRFIVDGTTATTAELRDIDSTAYGAYTSGGSVEQNTAKVTGVAVPTAVAPITITWTRASDANEYNIYKEVNGVYGLLGVASGESFKDIGTTPDTSDSSPFFRDPFIGEGNYPTTVGYIQQRLAFAGSDNNPEKVYMSQIGNFKNFTKSRPLQDDDAITFTIAGKQVNAIRHLTDIGRFLMLTSNGEWAALGDESGIIRPTAVNAKQYTYNGSGALEPLIVGGTIIYQQARGSYVRDLRFNVEFDGYNGDDLTIFSSHLFDNYTLDDWTYQQVPHSIVWAKRSDGALLGLTILREQKMLAWHRHDFDNGSVESVASVPVDNEDALHVVVERDFNGTPKKYVERVTTRRINDIKDYIGMDSAFTYDGRNSDSNHTMTLSGGTNWTYTETLTLTSSQAYFSSEDVGKEVHIESGDDIIRFTIDGFTSTTVVTGRSKNITVPVDARNAAISDWSLAIIDVPGLWHLEGKDVSILADGFVVSSPYNPDYNTITVADGVATLDKAYTYIHVGLPYVCDVETLDIDTSGTGTLVDKEKLLQEVTLYVESSRGIFVGAQAPDGESGLLENLSEYKPRSNESYNAAPALKTEAISVTIDSAWNSNGRVFIRQVDPLPMTILSINPSGFIPIGE